MTEPLVKIIEYGLKFPSIIEIEGQKYYSIPKVAEVIQVSHSTVFRWCQRRVVKFRQPSGIQEINLEVYRHLNGCYYLPEENVEKLRLESRAIPYKPQ